MRPLRDSRPFGPEERRELVRAAQEVFARHPEVIAAWLYGSAARGERAGDLDIAVLLSEDVVEPSLLERLASELRESGPSWPEIDLRPLRGTAPRFRATVLREGITLFDRHPRARLEFEARAMADWLDFKPVWELMRARLRDRWIGG